MPKSVSKIYRPEGSLVGLSELDSERYRRLEASLAIHKKALTNHPSSSYWRDCLESLEADLAQVVSAPDLLGFLEEEFCVLELYLAGNNIRFDGRDIM